MSDDEEERRHLDRQDTQTDKWLKGRRTQIRNIMTNSTIAGEPEIRSNETDADSQSITVNKTKIIVTPAKTKQPRLSSIGVLYSFL